MKYRIFQMVLGENDFDEGPKVDAIRGVMASFDNEKLRDRVARAIEFYDHVANVEANDLEHVFEIMNRWSEEDEERVERLLPLHSLSVGDVLEVDGMIYICASFGFIDLIKRNEAA